MKLVDLFSDPVVRYNHRPTMSTSTVPGQAYRYSTRSSRRMQPAFVGMSSRGDSNQQHSVVMGIDRRQVLKFLDDCLFFFLLNRCISALCWQNYEECLKSLFEVFCFFSIPVLCLCLSRFHQWPFLSTLALEPIHCLVPYLLVLSVSCVLQVFFFYLDYLYNWKFVTDLIFSLVIRECDFAV